ncbi:unnamed protein product [Mytilus coruscus]|uniref:MULE transposase domain-containing protein n=1 Tax=Mytilus coruscus TaxID=42192 RepID=A0A6J8DPT5_MYTCO|nr:unnamed protein product [Mytilus coruscus]
MDEKHEQSDLPAEDTAIYDYSSIVDAHFPEILQPLVSQQPDVTADDKQTKRKKVLKTPVKTAIQISSESSEDSLPDLMSSDGIHKAKKPIGVRYNAVFIVDLNEVDQKSIYADDNGVWNTASPRSYYRVDIRDGRIENVVPGNKSSYTHYLRRQYGTHQATYNERGVSFQRIISTATSKYNIKSRYAVVQYIHRDSEEGDIVMKAHGNAKDSQSRPFFKTDLSVLDNIKEETRETKPRQLFKKLVDDAGGPLYSSSASSEPRNLQQIYNIRSSTKAATKTDQLTHLVAQIRESTFVHDLAADGESLQYVLASEKQLMDLDTFCTHQLHFSVFSVDSTFNIGNYYVTNTCFENLRVVHASGKYKGRHPLEMGPTFVHTHRDENLYLRFFSALDRMIPNFRYQMQAIGSDGDEATMNAIAVSFTSESFVNLLCVSHKKENIEYKLKEMKSATPAIRHIVSDIFGTNVDSMLYQKGLIDSETTSEFDSRLRDLKTTWDHLVPTFHAWFVSNESEKFKSHLIKAVTDQAQLDGHFSNNRVESTNNNVKDWVGRSGKVTLPVFNRKVEEYVTCQQQEFEMAIYANGPYDLASTHTYLRKERHIWNGLNADERKQVIKQFWKSNVQGRKLLDKFLLINEHAENRSKSDHSLPKPETRPNVSSKRGISYDDYQLQIPGISEDLLKEMFEKAEGLLQSQDSILKTPGFEGVYVRHSQKIENVEPHLVTAVKTSGKIKCNNCSVYTALKFVHIQ